MTNKDLIELVKDILKDKCISRTLLASKLGMSKQSFAYLLEKKNFSLDDANKILNFLDLEIKEVKIGKK